MVVNHTSRQDVTSNGWSVCLHWIWPDCSSWHHRSRVLDHVIISRHWFSCMTSCRFFKACKQTTPTKRFNTDALNNQAIASKYAVEVHNRNALLQNLDPGDQNIDDAWETFKCAVHESASKILSKPHAPKKKMDLRAYPQHHWRSKGCPTYAPGDKPEIKRLTREINHALRLGQGETGTRRLLRLNMQWLEKISTLYSGNYGHVNSASATNQRLSRLKTVRDSPISNTACVDGKITSMICLTSHVMQQTPNSSVMLNKQHMRRIRTLTSSQAAK